MPATTPRLLLRAALIAGAVVALTPAHAVSSRLRVAAHDCSDQTQTRADQRITACAYLIDRLKTDAPFWKRETRGADARWVAPRASDEAAVTRWG